MSLYIASLNSGSNGNCYYIGNDQDAVLIDAGLSCRETERRMRRLGLSLEKVRGIFISHEHDDHIRGLEVLSKRYQLPVYITLDTLHQGHLSLDGHLVRSFTAQEPVVLGGLTILPFSKTHDAIDPHSFVVYNDHIHIGIFTDLGFVCENLTQHFRLCHAAFLESNYDGEMLENGRYPWPLKNRIRGGEGHLSNHEALELFVRHRPAFMSHLLLAHLSQDNNKPELALSLFEEAAQGTRIVVASRYNESEVYAIDGSFIGEAGIGATALWPITAATPDKKEEIVAPADAPNGLATPTDTPNGIGHSMIRRRKKALSTRPGQPSSTQTSLF